MNKLIYKNSIKFFIVSIILLAVSSFLKILNVDNADFILNISCSISLASLILVMLRYKIVREKKSVAIK